jgi:hypothetical protein
VELNVFHTFVQLHHNWGLIDTRSPFLVITRWSIGVEGWVEVILPGTSPVGQPETEIINCTLVVKAYESANFVTLGVQATLRHHHATLLRCNATVVRQEGQVVGLSFSILPNTNLLLTATSGVKNLVLLVEVKMANTKSCSKEATCELL